MGDSCNLAGCLLTHQFPIQTMTAIYYVAMDVSIIIQYYYYFLKNRPNAGGGAAAADFVPAASVVGLYGMSRTVRREMAPTPFRNGAQTAGYVVGLMSTVFYLGSRLPQIVMNFKRGKTDGVQPITFLLAVIANFAYAFSVSNNDRRKSLKRFRIFPTRLNF